MNRKSAAWALLIGINVLAWCVLSFDEPTSAAPQNARQPFANAVEQRAEMVRELKQISGLLKEQNALLRAMQSKQHFNGKKKL